MSQETKQRQAESESPYDAQVDALIKRFSALVEHSQALLFPSVREEVTAMPDMSGWPLWRRFAFAVHHPVHAVWSQVIHHSREPSLIAGFIYLLAFASWFLASKAWLVAADIFMHGIFGTLQPRTPQAEASVLDLVVLRTITVLTLIMIPVAYWRWAGFFRDTRYSVRWRVILTLCFVVLAISFPYWGMLPEYRVKFPTLLLEDRPRLILFIMTYVLFLVPLGTFYYHIVTLDTIIMGAQVCMAFLRYIVFAHHPLPEEQIRKLVLEPISAEDNGEEWRLTELKPTELEVLRRWAVANREGADKRLLPTALFFGVLAVFANTQTFSDVIDRVLVWFSELFTLAPELQGGVLTRMGKWTVLLFVLIPGGICIYVILLLFRNLVTQSVIVEACIVAQYAREQLESPDSVTETAMPHKGFWKRLLGLFGKY